MKAKDLIEQLKFLRPECEINVRTEGDIWWDFTLDVKGADLYFALIHLEARHKPEYLFGKKKRKCRKGHYECTSCGQVSGGTFQRIPRKCLKCGSVLEVKENPPDKEEKL